MRLLASIAVAVLASATVAQAQTVCTDSGPCGVRADPPQRSVLVCSSTSSECTHTGGWCPYEGCLAVRRDDALEVLFKFKVDGHTPERGVPNPCPDRWALMSAAIKDGQLEVLCRHVDE